MNIPDHPQERKNWMMKILQGYGREFLIFEPEDQPNVFAAPEPEYRDLKSGILDPRELRSWRYPILLSSSSASVAASSRTSTS
jgi:hypothetical protein